jgi:hypothetical protein
MWLVAALVFLLVMLGIAAITGRDGAGNVPQNVTRFVPHRMLMLAVALLAVGLIAVLVIALRHWIS